MNPFNVESIDSLTLSPIVQRSLNRDAFTIHDWRVSQLGGGAGNPVSVGLYRFEGTGQDRGEHLTWSVILKVIQSPANAGLENMGEKDDPTHWNYWKREPSIYRSGILENLPGDICAPRYFGVAEMPGDIIYLWLEDVTDSHQGTWSLDRYALAARHLGQLNGSYLGERSLPSFPFFSSTCIYLPLDKLVSISMNKTAGNLLAVSIELINEERLECLFDIDLEKEVDSLVTQTRSRISDRHTLVLN